MAVLVTGGLGYIGSHTCVELLNEGFDVIVVDNLCNSSIVVADKIKEITGKDFVFIKADVCDEEKMREIFSNYKIEDIIHFAGLKAVGESVQIPVKYYKNNLISSLVILDMMKEFGVKNLVFSSSATVYGDPETCPISEDFPRSTTNPYGSTKLMIENILMDLYNADKSYNISILRYFNPLGADISGKIGEDPCGIPNNLVPYIAQVAVGRLDELKVFGDDYDTKDGTGVRDYIHVVDLAKGHIKALEKLKQNSGLIIHNLGTGNGYSVLEVINTFSKVSGKKIPYKIIERRAGDIAECFADPSKAEIELGWKAEYNLERMCEDTWRWQSQNPNGFEEK
ncbi:MAG: UDP-glucose 4-epimerase GalE [Clostridioides sp.]|jgi:UDP-glucose 4-epimerase|nr:UDP-glucose 4-epimerase GalE [Clostridioides sp.]